MSGRPRDDSWLYADDTVAVSILLFGRRTCSQCGAELANCSDYFGRDAARKDGITLWCRRCRAVQANERTPEQRERKRQRQRERYRRTKAAL